MNYRIACVLILVVALGAVFLYRFFMLPSLLPTDTQETSEPIRFSHTLDSLNHIPIDIAYEAGIFKKYGLDVEFVPMQGGEEVAIALSTGQIEVGSGGSSRFVSVIDRGAPIKMVSYLVLTPVQLLVRVDSNLRTFSDLEGTTIASRAGSPSDLALRYAFEREGVNLDSIEFVTIDRVGQMLALTQQKIIDAIVVSQDEVAAYEEAGAHILDAWRQSIYSTDLSPGTIMMSTLFLEERPEEAQAFMDAVIEASLYLRDYPEESAALISQLIKRNTDGAIEITQEEILTFLQGEEAHFVLWHDPSLMQEISELMFSLDLVTHALTVEELFDLRFDDQLKAAHEHVYAEEN